MFKGDTDVPGEAVQLVDYQHVELVGESVVDNFLKQRALRHVIGTGRYAFFNVLVVGVPLLAFRVVSERPPLGVQAIAFDLFFVADPGVQCCPHDVPLLVYLRF